MVVAYFFGGYPVYADPSHNSRNSPCRFYFVPMFLEDQVPDEVTKVAVICSRFLHRQFNNMRCSDATELRITKRRHVGGIFRVNNQRVKMRKSGSRMPRCAHNCTQAARKDSL